MGPLEQLQQILGNDWSTEHIRSVLPQIQALGIHVQNETRGDLRPRFGLPDGTTWDFGPEGWIGRGDYGQWWTADQGDGGGGTGGGTGDTGGTGGDGIPRDGGDTSGGAGGGFSIPPGTNPMEYFLHLTPGWQFAQGQAQRAEQTSAGARGTLLNRPRTLSALGRYNTGVADQTYGPQVNRYLSLADLGLRGATAPFS